MIPDKVRAVLTAHGLTVLEFEPGSTPTAELAAARIARVRPGVLPAHIAKSLLFRKKGGGYCMVVCPGDRRIPSSALKRVIGAKARMAGPEETERETGFKPGGVCPFGVDSVEIYLDRALAQYATIYPAAGTDATGVPMTLDTLARITGGHIVDFEQDGDADAPRSLERR